jgi:release factor glutamine methyltransferase
MTKAQLVEKLAEIGSTEPQSEAKIILEELFGASPSSQLTEKDKDYTSAELDSLLARRAQHEPLQYILGYAYFCDEKYYLSKDTLIPRSDTEILVSTAVRLLKRKGRFADLCTGSGCIAISVLKRRPDLSAVAIDISEGAVEIASKNSKENGVQERLEILCADVRSTPLKDRYDAILANPPYIPTSVVDTLSPELSYEPRLALDGGEDGMDLYRYIIEHYCNNLNDEGFFAFEIGYDQKDLITDAAKSFELECRIVYDYSNNPRVAVISRQAHREEDELPVGFFG